MAGDNEYMLKKMYLGRAARFSCSIAISLLTLLAAGCATSSGGAPTKQVSSGSLVKAADQTRDSGNLAAAALLYQRAEQLDPKDIDAPLQLGNIYAQLDAPRQAAAAYQRALAIDPNNVTALRGLANAELQVGDPQAAISTLRSAAAIHPDWRTQNSLGVAYDMMGDFPSAQDAYRQGLTLAPENLQLTSNLGLSLALSGRFDEALPILEKAAHDPGATARIRQNLALAYGLAGDDQKAAATAAIDLDPAKVQANLGYYEYLRLLHDRKALAAAIGAHPAETPQ
jgi:Flp pilus assembly protein TadD